MIPIKDRELVDVCRALILEHMLETKQSDGTAHFPPENGVDCEKCKILSPLVEWIKWNACIGTGA